MSSLNLPSVKSQRTALKIDTRAASFSGWTELRVTPSAAIGGGSLGLHCYDLAVQAVLVNGTPASYQLLPPIREALPDVVTGATHESPQCQLAAVAESAFYLYERQLQRERLPELSIQLPAQAPHGQQGAEGSGSGGSGGKDELLVHVEYSCGGSGGGAGVQFWGRYASTDNQVRRASAWLPCVDVPSAAVLFELDITCRIDEMAVGPGQLLRQSWAGGSGRQWRTFHYSVPVRCAPCHLGFAVGTFRVVAEALPAIRGARGTDGAAAGGKQKQTEEQQRQLTHFAPLELPPELAVAVVLAVPPVTTTDDPPTAKAAAAAADGLARSAHFFTLAFSLFEELLGAQFPLPAMQQVFLPPTLLLSDSQALVGLQLLGTPQLIQTRTIEQSIAARCAIAHCLARQWFGVLLRAASPLDEWLVEGLSGWLEEQAVRRFMGRNELAYRRWQERQAIFLADNGEAPPLAARGMSVPSPWGALYGTERLDPSRLWSIKATAVIAMLEKRAGEELFRKHVSDVVAAGIVALHAEQAAAAAGTPGGARSSSPQQQRETGVVGSCLLDTMTFLNDLGRAGSFRKEMGPFAARWVYGRGVPHISAAFIYHSRTSLLELALRQTGPESAKRAADVAERAAVAEGSNAGIIKAVVREGEPPQYTDHPVHLGAEAFVLAELKVTPIVEKKQPGRKSRKRKNEVEEAPADTIATVATPEEPVLWVRLDPAGELLCDIKLMQSERMLAAQLLHSRDVVAQAEAIQRLAEMRVNRALRAPPGVEALRRTLHDRAVFYRVRCDAALALAGLRDEEGQPAGLSLLLDFYRSQYFVPCCEVPRSVAIADPSEYYVAQAAATAVSLCREADGSTPIDALLFLSTCLNEYASVPGAPFSDYGLVTALCASLGNVQFEGFGDSLLTLLEKFLERDSVLVSPDNAIGCACLSAMAALCANGTCSEEEQERVAATVERVRQSRGLPVAVRHAALAAAMALATARHGPAASLQLALAAAEAREHGAAAAALQLPAATTPAFLLEEAARLVTAATEAAAAVAAATAMIGGEQQQEGKGGGGGAMCGAMPIPLPLPLLQRLAALLSAARDCRVRHLAFVLLQLLAVQPPTLYRPPSGEAEEDAAAFFTSAAAAAAGQAVSMGATHRTGPHISAGTAAAAAAAAASKTIRLQLGGAGGAAAATPARSTVLSGGPSGPAPSGEGPSISDARAVSFGAVEQPLPLAGQGQLFSPVAEETVAVAPFGATPADGCEEASSRQPMLLAPSVLTASVPRPSQQQQQQQRVQHAAAEQYATAVAPAIPPPAAKVRLKMPAPRPAAVAPVQQQEWQAPPQLQQAWQQPFVPVLPPAASGTPGQCESSAWLAGGAPAGVPPAMPPPVQPHPQQQLAGGPPGAPVRLKMKFKVKLPTPQ